MPGSASRSATTLFLFGALAIVFGLLAAAWPLSTALALVMLWGAYALVDGVAAFFAVPKAQGAARWWLILSGVVGVLAGLVALFQPLSSAVALAWVLGIWLVVRGVLEIAAAFGHDDPRPKWLLVVGGALWIIAGILFVANPGAAALTISLWLGVLAIIWGAMLIGAGFTVRSAAKGANAPA